MTSSVWAVLNRRGGAVARGRGRCCSLTVWEWGQSEEGEGAALTRGSGGCDLHPLPRETGHPSLGRRFGAVLGPVSSRIRSVHDQVCRLSPSFLFSLHPTRPPLPPLSSLLTLVRHSALPLHLLLSSPLVVLRMVPKSLILLGSAIVGLAGAAAVPGGPLAGKSCLTTEKSDSSKVLKSRLTHLFHL